MPTPLQATIEAAEFDALPETTVLGKDAFIKGEKEDKFFLNFPDFYSAQESVRKLTDNNRELLKQKGNANSELEAYKALGMSPDEVKALRESKEPQQFQELLAKKEQDFEARLKSATEETAKERAEREAAEKRLIDTLQDATVERVINENKMTPSARFALKEAIRIERDENGEWLTRVYEDGKPAYHGPDPMKPEHLAAKMKEKYPELFYAGTGAGSGADARQQGGFTGKTFTVSRSASKTNPQLYQHAKEQADKVGGTVQWTD